MAFSTPRIWTASPRNFAFLLSILLIWQLVFWSIVHMAERLARPPSMDRRTQVHYQFVDTQSASPAPGSIAEAKAQGPVFVAARSQTQALYNVLERSQAARVRFLLPFELSDRNGPIALYLSVRNSIDRISVNGHVAQTVSDIARLRGLVTAEPAHITLPAEHLRAGTNLVAVETPNVGAQWLSEFAIGPAEDLLQSFRWKRFLQSEIALAGVAIIAFTILLCLVVRWPPEDHRRIGTLVALLGVCGLSTVLLSFTPPFGLTPVHVAFLFALFSVFIALSVLAYVMVDWAIIAVRKLGYVAAVATALIACAYWFAIHLGPLGDWIRYTIYVSFWIVIASVAIALIALAAAVVRDQGGRWFERSVLAFSISAMALDRLTTLMELHSPWDPELSITLGWSNIVGALLGLSVVVALAREAGEARRVVVSANEVLRNKLSEREAELKESYAREAEIEKRAVLLAERQRLTRDMHDGIGGQLVSLQMRLRNQALEPVAIEYAVSDCLNDLRLIVDALDDAELDLSDALLHFERRVREQLTASGIDFEAKEIQGESQSASAPVLGPKPTLHVIRILQEAITNAVRHANATKILLTTQFTPMLEITLQDDGIGLDPANEGSIAGHGLLNMQCRAQALGGQLRLSAADPDFAAPRVGCKLQLCLARAPGL